MRRPLLEQQADTVTRVLVDRLKQTLRADIAAIQPHDQGVLAGRAHKRLDAVAEHFPAFMAMLVQPWWADIQADETLWAVVQAATRVHLYARVLDDAVDEGQPIHRMNLLRSQPMLWQAAGVLFAAQPTLCNAMTELISQTVVAVQADDAQRQIACWGAKNHHLLLAPLALSGNSSAYMSCRQGLSNLIALLQAGDEWRQGELDASVLSADLLRQLPQFIGPESITPLLAHGWSMAAERMVWESRQLLRVMGS